MKIEKLDRMKRGWFIGNFEPTLSKTNDVEIAVKKYKKGDNEKKHYHKQATEFTVLVLGKVQMNGKVLQEGDIAIIEPNETTDFVVLEDSTTVVVKKPGSNNDKYYSE